MMNNKTFRFELKHLTLLIVEGDDRETFLQGQLTNDIRDLSEGWSQLDGLCTPKGRMLANMRLITGENLYFMLVASELAESVLKRLSMFILRSKVSISPASEDFSFFGLSGSAAGDLLEIKLEKIDETKTTTDGCSITRIAGEIPRYLVAGPAAAIRSRLAALKTKSDEADDNDWKLADIRAGLPWVHEGTVEAFVPQMVNLPQVNGVSFTKGCYTGQEVVARMQYLGKLKRRMYRVAIDGDCPAPGTALFSPQSQSGQGAGMVVMSAPAGDQRCEALVVTEINNAESGDVNLENEAGPQLEFLDLPYTFAEEVSENA